MKTTEALFKHNINTAIYGYEYLLEQTYEPPTPKEAEKLRNMIKGLTEAMRIYLEAELFQYKEEVTE